MKTQREAVYTATHAVLKEKGIKFEDGQDIDPIMKGDTTLRSMISVIICAGLEANEVALKDTKENDDKLANPAKLSSYVSGLISNWFRKDKRFNGGVTYKPKNPGSRAGQGDAQLKALRGLFKQFDGVDQGQAEKLQVAITERVAAIQAEKAKSTPIDLTVLSPELLEELGLEIAEVEA